MPEPSLRQLERHIRECANDSANVVLTTHARQRMKLRHITLPMVIDTLKRGVLGRPPEPDMRHPGLRCWMQGFVAGMDVAVVVYVEHPAPGLVVVTVIDVNGD